MWTKTSILRYLILSLACLFFAAGAGICAPISLSNRVALVWNTHDGLPQDRVKSILQARDGYIWVATQDGVAKFDGKQFTTYDTGNTPGLATNNIEQMREDGAGDLWVSGEGGISRFHNGVAKDFTPPTAAAGNLSVVCQISPTGQLWAEHDRNFYNVHGDALTLAEPSSILGGAVMTSWCPGLGGALWLGTREGAILEVRDGAVRHYQMPDASQNAVVSLQCDNAGTVWIGTEAGMAFIKNQTLHRVIGQPSQPSFTSIVCDAAKIWGLRGGRLYEIVDGRAAPSADFPETHIQAISLDAAGHLICRYMAEKNSGERVALLVHGAFLYQPVSSRIAGAAVCALSDHAGNIWIGTDEGLSCLRDRNGRTFTPTNGLPPQPITTLFTDLGGRLWAVNNKFGLYNYSGGSSGAFRRIASDSAPITTLAETPDGDMLALCGGRVKKLDGGRLTDVSAKYGLAPNRVASTMTVTHDGVVWLGVWDKFWRTQAGKTVAVANPSGGSWFFTSYVDRLGRLWATTREGLYCVDGDSVRVYRSADGVRGVIIISICETTDGSLWFGHWGGGLTRFRGKVFRHIDMRQGLYSDGVYQILQDGNADSGKNLWIGSSKGIFRVSLRDLNDVMDGRQSLIRCYPYGPADGAFVSQCVAGQQPSASRTLDGCLWFSALEGIVRINPNDLDTTPAKVLVDQALVDGRLYATEKPATAPPGDGDVAIHFTALDYRNPSHLRFEYQLQGFDSSWREGDNSRTAFYTNLPPGRYHFVVRCINTESGWSGRESFAFTLRPYYYQTLVFKAMLTALVLGLLFGATFLQLERLRRRNSSLQKIQDLLEARNEALTASQNELMATQQALKEANARLYAQATTDGLTGLTNHRAFREQLEREWQMKERSGMPLSLLLIDVDNFKSYNDTYGHPAGDEILIAVARLLHESARDTDTVARYGGEEFVIILHGADAENAFLVAERYRATIADALWPNRPITVSIGASTTSSDINTQATLIAASDVALYWSKEHGRNRVMHISEIVPDARSFGA
jgi:diguanylate cyclase (GGDEF)-like protein